MLPQRSVMLALIAPVGALSLCVPTPLQQNQRGRPRLLLPDAVTVAQAIKRYARRRVTGVGRRVVRDTEEAVRVRLSSTQGTKDAVINAAYIERSQATFRSRLAPLVRRTRAAARQRTTLAAGMWLGLAPSTT